MLTPTSSSLYPIIAGSQVYLIGALSEYKDNFTPL